MSDVQFRPAGHHRQSLLDIGLAWPVVAEPKFPRDSLSKHNNTVVCCPEIGVNSSASGTRHKRFGNNIPLLFFHLTISFSSTPVRPNCPFIVQLSLGFVPFCDIQYSPPLLCQSGEVAEWQPQPMIFSIDRPRSVWSVVDNNCCRFSTNLGAARRNANSTGTLRRKVNEPPRVPIKHLGHIVLLQIPERHSYFFVGLLHSVLIIETQFWGYRIKCHIRISLFQSNLIESSPWWSSSSFSHLLVR